LAGRAATIGGRAATICGEGGHDGRIGWPRLAGRAATIGGDGGPKGAKLTEISPHDRKGGLPPTWRTFPSGSEIPQLQSHLAAFPVLGTIDWGAETVAFVSVIVFLSSR
jgi:hypothetical protein